MKILLECSTRPRQIDGNMATSILLVALETHSEAAREIAALKNEILALRGESLDSIPSAKAIVDTLVSDIVYLAGCMKELGGALQAKRTTAALLKLGATIPTDVLNGQSLVAEGGSIATHLRLARIFFSRQSLERSVTNYREYLRTDKESLDEALVTAIDRFLANPLITLTFHLE